MTEHQEVWSRLYWEFMEVREKGTWLNDTPGNVSAIIDPVASWVKTGNPFYMDHAVEIAEELEAPRTKTFVEQMKSAMYSRRLGTAKGTWKQVRRKYMQDRAFQVICNLRYHGAPIEEAAEKASVWLDKYSRGDFCHTAAALEKMYQVRYVKTGLENTYHEAWSGEIVPGTPEWQQVRDGMPTIGAERQARKGTRR